METLQDFMISFYESVNIKDIKKLHNKTVLITGASGLIGSNIISYLIYLNKTKKVNIKIIGIVYSTIESWMEQDVTYIKGDLTTTNDFIPRNFDFLIHCATYGQPKKVLEQAKKTVMLNTEVLFDLLDLAKINHAPFLFISSSEIYGEILEAEAKEDLIGNVNTLSERALYAESKRIAETICFLYKDKISVKIARTLIAYGPGVRYTDQRVIAEFIKKAQEKKEIQMMDEGMAERTFCFVVDTLEMLLNIILSGNEMVYNISGATAVTIKELAEEIAKINKAQVILPTTSQAISGTPKRSTLSNSKYCKEFNKKRFTSLEDGLKITSTWFDFLRKANNEKQN